MNKCLECLIEFTPTKIGIEQKYCSQKCRHLAYRNRKMNIDESKETNIVPESNNSIERRQSVEVKSVGNLDYNYSSPFIVDAINGKYHQAKAEMLEREINKIEVENKDLKEEIKVLKMRLEDYDESEDSSEDMGAIGNIAKAAIDNPMGAATLIGVVFKEIKEIFKPVQPVQQKSNATDARKATAPAM
jgi:hypothetical protein